MDLWTEKYRPSNLDEYVWRDAEQRQQVEDWIKSGSLPHVLFGGAPGSGKTSLALMAMKLLNVPNGDVLMINASRERNPDIVATKIENFCTTWSLSGMKYVILDECDRMTPLAQGILRGITEQYQESVRFILTCNEPRKIIPAIHSRCQGFTFAALDLQEFTIRIAGILAAEGVSLETEQDIDILDRYVELTHPDLRRCINLLQQNTQDGKLRPPRADSAGTQDYLIEMVKLFSEGRVSEARKVVVTQAQPDEYNSIYRFMYQNLAIWGTTDAQQNEALMIISKGVNNHTLAGDAEINLAATFVQLSQIAQMEN